MKNNVCKLLFFITIAANAQQQVHHQALYWLRYQTHLDFSPNVYWTNEIDNRRFFHPDVQSQFIFHSRLHYRHGPWDFGSGLTMSWSFSQIPEDGYESATMEIRPVAEISHEKIFGKIILTNRLRTDHRFFEVNDGESIWENSRYVLRLRYRIQAKIPVVRTEDKTNISLKLAEEIMINHNRNLFDQNRINVIGEFYVNDILSLEAGYIFIYQQRYGGHDFFSRHVARLSVLHKIGVRH